MIDVYDGIHLFFLWANLERIVEKRGRIGKKGVERHPRGGDTRVKEITRNSPGDEIANVNFLYDDIVHAVKIQ